MNKNTTLRRLRNQFLGFLLGGVVAAHPLLAADPGDSTQVQNWSVHFQQTVINQFHSDLKAKYSGLNSLQTHEKSQTSLTTTLFIGRKLWKGAAIYFDPELAGGSGLSGARGIAGFTNGETFRIGDPKPQVYVARAFLKQIIPLSSATEYQPDNVNQVGGMRPTSYLSLAFGKFSIADFFDANQYSHDPRSQFLNWALMSNGAWDYPANTRGYTYGLVVELVKPTWTLRAASTMVPEEANGPYLDLNLKKAHSETLEFEKSYTLGSQPGKMRLLTFLTHADMGSYAQAISQSEGLRPDVTQTRQQARSKYGFGVNLEQSLNERVALFARASWNDGKNETWAFTEIDRSASLGVSLDGQSWNRKADRLGVAMLANGLSPQHRDYLKAGGYGFIIGDGALRYQPELIEEIYYSFHLLQYPLWLAPDYQFVLHPAYNRDRGPVHVFALRFHIEV